nr:hypothetical protein [Candidatus Cloacimonadota bacterium]
YYFENKGLELYTNIWDLTGNNKDRIRKELKNDLKKMKEKMNNKKRLAFINLIAKLSISNIIINSELIKT